VTGRYTLSPRINLTHFRVAEESGRLLLRLANGAEPEAGPELDDLVEAVKARADILEPTT
jgi:hypothetical protein